MPQVDFYFSNDRHHIEMFFPVVQALAAQPGYVLRWVSLCEFRGIPTPTNRLETEGVKVIRVIPHSFRRASSGGTPSSGTVARLLRTVARLASWHLLLKRPLAHIGSQRADLAVVPNDAAFPYNHLARQLRRNGTPFLLVQEGIRFPLPAERHEARYGAGGATAIAAWGKSSARFFEKQGAKLSIIHLTGNPRFSVIDREDWQVQASEIARRLGLRGRTLLFLSNPIDDQGFCDSVGKLGLVRHFIEGITPLFQDPTFRLLLKLHGRESTSDFQRVVDEFSFSERITVLNDAPLYPLFILAHAAVILASSVGLEALMMGLPLGVLEIPGHGFVHDYVLEGAATGLHWNQPMHEQINSLMEIPPQIVATRARRYVDYTLAVRDNSTSCLVSLIHRLVSYREMLDDSSNLCK